jgi:hypothetical protein
MTTSAAEGARVEQAVLIRFPLSDGGLGSACELEVLGGLSDDIADVVAESGAGEFDGHEVGEGEYLLFLYGPDADELFDAVEPLLSRQPWPGGASAVKRYGPPGAAEVRVTIGQDAEPGAAPDRRA